MTKSDTSLYIILPWLDLNLKVSFQGGTEKWQRACGCLPLPVVNIASCLFLDRLDFRGGGRSMKWERCPMSAYMNVYAVYSVQGWLKIGFLDNVCVLTRL